MSQVLREGRRKSQASSQINSRALARRGEMRLAQIAYALEKQEQELKPEGEGGAGGLTSPASRAVRREGAVVSSPGGSKTSWTERWRQTIPSCPPTRSEKI